ncbi:MAG: TlpA family protein disulfide reductase [Oscillospiraceae bacterium]|nr:TlpA family protein disulfide reductase [Oscillospiraceae bacterium]
MKKLILLLITVIFLLCSTGCLGLLEAFLEDFDEYEDETTRKTTKTESVEASEYISDFSDEPGLPGITREPRETATNQEPANTPANTQYYSFPFEFTAKDLYGNTVTQEALGEKQIFFVHLWATWCPPCIAEMPELAEIAQMYGDDVGFIALVDDYSSNLSGAKRIADSSNIPTSFIMVDAYTKGLEPLMNMLNTGYVPTTVIIDGNGIMLGEALIGAYGMAYAPVIDTFLGA